MDDTGEDATNHFKKISKISNVYAYVKYIPCSNVEISLAFVFRMLAFGTEKYKKIVF